jgi:hypothetical protein
VPPGRQAHGRPGEGPMALLLLGDLPGIEQAELDPAGYADDAGLAGLAGREVAGLLGSPRAGPVRAVAGEEAGHEDLGQERGEGEAVAPVGGFSSARYVPSARTFTDFSANEAEARHKMCAPAARKARAA